MDKTFEPKKVYDILKGFSTAMFVTVGDGGKPGARPMHVAHIEETTGTVSFLTGQHGTLASEVANDSLVLLAFQNENSAYLSVRGRARVGSDKAKIKEVWQEPYKVWFPKGPEDPEIALVTVQLVDAEYWDNRGMNRLEYLFEAAKAYVKGTTPEGIDNDIHAKATL